MIKNSLSMGTIAVTGATGYLAEKLIERLITQGHTIHAIARNEGKLIALREKFKSVQIFPCPACRAPGAHAAPARRRDVRSAARSPSGPGRLQHARPGCAARAPGC